MRSRQGSPVDQASEVATQRTTELVEMLEVYSTTEKPTTEWPHRTNSSDVLTTISTDKMFNLTTSIRADTDLYTADDVESTVVASFNTTFADLTSTSVPLHSTAGKIGVASGTIAVLTARCTLVQSAVLRSHVVCLSVSL